jgi:DNA polymerase-3 subunit epsilon
MTRPWHQDMIMGVDVEATGVNARRDRIVQWCAALDNPEAVGPLIDSQYINPGIPIPQGAIDVHHITDEYVQRFGATPVQSITNFVNVLANAIKARVPIGGMNLAYDLTMLHFECRRHGVPTVEEAAGLPLAPVLDVYVLDKYVDKYRKGIRKLADKDGKKGLATHYGIVLPAEDAHDAVADTLATVKVLRRIGQHYGSVGRLSPYKLHLAQVDWRREQQASLEQYLRTKKDPPQPGVVIDRCWPVCTDPTHQEDA